MPILEFSGRFRRRAGRLIVVIRSESPMLSDAVCQPGSGCGSLRIDSQPTEWNPELNPMKMPTILMSLVIAGLLSATGLAQGYRVETRLYDTTPKNDESGQLTSSSLTLFQNGKVYDYVEKADEVIIFDPTAERFVILNTARSMRTTVTCEEIRHLLSSRRSECENYLREVTESGHVHAESIARNLRFQLDPKFESSFDAGKKLLVLKSPSWKYQVTTHTWQDPDQVSEYLDYADKVAQLNFVLHPSSLFPEPRMALNQELRKLENEMPTTVRLDLRPYDASVLRADHKFVLDLNSADRSRIRAWEAAAENGSLATKSFRSYQETVLLTRR